MVQAHDNYLSKPMVNLMAIVSISLKSHGNYLYSTNIQVIIRGLHSRSGELCKRTFLIHLGSCQNFATSLFNLLPLLHGESLKCSHEELRITIVALHKQKSDPSLTWIHLAISWHYSKPPTAVSSHYTIYPAATKVWKVTASVKALHC